MEHEFTNCFNDLFNTGIIRLQNALLIKLNAIQHFSKQEMVQIKLNRKKRKQEQSFNDERTESKSSSSDNTSDEEGLNDIELLKPIEVIEIEMLEEALFSDGEEIKQTLRDNKRNDEEETRDDV